MLRDADFRIVDVNPAYEAMSGYTREEVLGADRVLAHPAQVTRPLKALHRRALAGEPIQLETEGRRKDGTRFEIELRGVPIRHRGQPHVLYIGRDITARKRARPSGSRSSRSCARRRRWRRSATSPAASRTTSTTS